MNYVADEDKIEEKTLICVDGKWLFYDDDPKLEGAHYATAKALLQSMGDRLHEPLKAVA